MMLRRPRGSRAVDEFFVTSFLLVCVNAPAMALD